MIDLRCCLLCACHQLFVLVIFLASKRWKKVPHFATLQLSLSQSMTCLGVIAWYWCDIDSAGHDGMGAPDWVQHVQFCVFVIGVFSSRIWSALLAVTLLLLRKKSVAFIIKFRPVLLAVGWGLVSTAFFFFFFFSFFFIYHLCIESVHQLKLMVTIGW